MDKFKAWAEDKKNQPILIAIVVIVLLGAVFTVLKTSGMIGGGGAPSQDMSGVSPGAATTPDAGGAAGPSASTTPPVGGGTAAVPNATAGAPAGAPAGGVTTTKLAPILPYRKDPFLPYSGMPTRKDVISVLLPSLRRPRIAPAPVVNEGPTQTAAEVPPPQPFRRMAGVMWNGHVSAILETAGETDIVRPGMELSRGNSRVRVESITQDSVILKTLDTRTPMTIKVGMAGSVTGNSATATPSGPDMMQNGPTY